MLTVKAHEGAIYSLTFTPSGLLVSGGVGGPKFWNFPALDRQEKSLNPHVWCTAISPDGRYLAVGGSAHSLEVIDLTGNLPQQFLHCQSSVSTVAFLGASRLVFTLGDRANLITASCTLMFIDIPKMEPKRSSFGAVNGIRCLVADAGKKLVAWATDHKLLRVQDITRPAARDVALKKECRALALSPDSKKLAVASDWDVLLYDAEHWPSKPTTLGRHQGAISSLVFTPDGRSLLSGGWDSTVRWWDLDRETERACFHWPVGRVSALAIAPDGLRAAVAGEMGEITVWDLDD